MTTAIVPYGDIERMGNALAKSNLFGIKTPEQAIALMLVAQAQGLHPASVAMEYDVINNRPALKSQAALARFKRAGGKIEYIERTPQRVKARFSEGGATIVVEWDMARAKAMKLDEKDNWIKQPMIMLQWRVVAEGIRAIAPECLGSAYLVEEVQDFDPPRNITPERAPVSMPKELPPPAPPAPPAPEEKPKAPVPEPENPKAQAPASGDAVVVGFVTEVLEKTGKKANGTAWTAYQLVMGGEKYSTFDTKQADIAKDACENGQELSISYVTNAKGYHNVKQVGYATVTDPTAGLEEQAP